MDMEQTLGVPEALDAVKVEKWNKVAAEVDQITDKLGEPIDQGIKETVIACRVLGFTTDQSCEGHLEKGSLAPWISFDAPIDKSLVEQAKFAWGIAEKAEEEGASRDELSKLYDEAHRLHREIDKPELEESKKIMKVLSEFYEERQVSYDRRITIGPPRMLRIQSQGAFLQEIATSDERAQKLKEYQEEMSAFTKFLKDKYFSSDF